MGNILTCTFMGSHLDANKSFQNNFLNCVLKLLFRDTVVNNHLGFLKSTEQHRRQKLTGVGGEREKQKANPVLWSIERIRRKLSTSKGGLSLLTAQVIDSGTLWAQWIIFPLTDAFQEQFCSPVCLPLWLILVQQEQGPETITIRYVLHKTEWSRRLCCLLLQIYFQFTTHARSQCDWHLAEINL